MLQIVAALVAIFLFALCLAEHAPTKPRYEPPRIPEYRYRPPPDYQYQYKLPDYRLPKIEVPPIKP